MTVTEKAKELKKLRAKRDKDKDKAKASEAEYRKCEAELMQLMEAEDTDAVKVSGVLFSPTETVYAKMDDRTEFVEWARENAPELIEDRERKELTNQLVRERLDNGEVLPPGLGFYVRQYISQRKG